MLERKTSPNKSGEVIQTGFQLSQLTFASSAPNYRQSEPKSSPGEQRDTVLTWSRKGLRKEGSNQDDGEAECGDVHPGQGQAARAEAGPEQVPPVPFVRCWLSPCFL